MNRYKKINPLSSLIIISFLIGIYQINLVETKLNKYKISNNLSTTFPLGLNTQQFVENSKISLANFSVKKGKEIQKISDDASINNNLINQNIVLEDILKEPEQKNLSSYTATTLIESNKKCTEKCTILTIGDSIMGDVYYSLSRKLKKYHPDWKIIDAHKVSSGLSNSSYYNWPNVAKKLVDEINPDYVLIVIGMNDAQGIMENNKPYQFNSNDWSKIYTQRTKQIFDIINTQRTAYWIELPHVSPDSFDKKLKQVREIHELISEKNYIDVTNLLGTNKDPKFTNLRQPDGVHLNANGSDMIADYIYTHQLN